MEEVAAAAAAAALMEFLARNRFCGRPTYLGLTTEMNFCPIRERARGGLCPSTSKYNFRALEKPLSLLSRRASLAITYLSARIFRTFAAPPRDKRRSTE